MVDLVEGHPILDLALIARKDRLGIALERIDHMAAGKAVVLLRQVQRHIEVVERHHGLDTVLATAVEHAIIEGQALLVGNDVVTEREDTTPGDRHAEHRESHLGEQRDILLVGVVEVDAATLGEVVFLRMLHTVGERLTRHRVQRSAFDDTLPSAGLTIEQNRIIRNSRAASALVPRPLNLVGSGSTAPKEPLGERLVELIRAQVDHSCNPFFKG